MKHFPIFLLLCVWLNLPAQNPPTQIAEFSVWSQRVDLSAYLGKKYRLSAAIRTEPATPESFAIAFVRNEPPEGGLRSWTYMDNMGDRPVRDTTWKMYTLEYVVDKKAPWLGFGFLGFSNGTFYFDDLHLRVESAPGVWTELSVPNSDFEQGSLDPWTQTSLGVPAQVLGASAAIVTHRPFEGKQCLRIENRFLKK